MLSANQLWSTTAAAPAAVFDAEAVARSAPDGYTLLVGSNGPLTINPFVQAKLGYDPLKDFAPIALISYVPHVIILNNNVEAKNITALIALSKKARISIATSGIGSATHMTLERFKAAIGAKIVHVPYRSGGALMPDLTGGSIQAAMTEFSTALPLHKGWPGPYRRDRSEQSLRNSRLTSRPSLRAASRELQKAIAGGLASGPASDKLRGTGSEIATVEQMTPDGFAKFIRADYQNMREAAQLAGITPQ